MKAIHLAVYGNPAGNLKMVEVSEPNALSAKEALVRMEYAQLEVKVLESSRQSGRELWPITPWAMSRTRMLL